MAVGRPGEQRGNSGLERGGVLRDQLTGNPNREEMEKSIREGQRYAGDPIACGKDRIGLRLGVISFRRCFISNGPLAAEVCTAAAGGNVCNDEADCRFALGGALRADQALVHRYCPSSRPYAVIGLGVSSRRFELSSEL